MTILAATTTGKKRFDEFDAFRLFAAICVVIIHVSASAMGKFQTGSHLQLLITIINGLALFAVPGFIAISGLTIHLSYQSKPFILKDFFKKRIVTLAIPYIAWTLIYYLDQLYFSRAAFSINDFLRHLLLGTAFYHLYFMPIIFQFYLLYPLFNRLLQLVKPSSLLVLSLILFVLYIGSSLPLLSGVNFPWPIKAEIPYSDRFFMSYLPFYVLGMLMGHGYPWFLKHIKGILAMTLPLYALSVYSHLLGRVDYFVFQKNPLWQLPLAWEISSFCAIILLVALFSGLSEKGWLPPWISKISALTFTLYLAHPLILQLCEIKLGVIANMSLSLYYLLTLFLCILLPLTFGVALNRIKKKWLN